MCVCAGGFGSDCPHQDVCVSWVCAARGWMKHTMLGGVEQLRNIPLPQTVRAEQNSSNPLAPTLLFVWSIRIVWLSKNSGWHDV